MTVSGIQRCVNIGWQSGGATFFPSIHHGASWHGSLVKDKADGAGTFFRRNRYYDPTTGRFTQEDPIGLAGGLNLYGFAGGDAVNYGDPLGLKVCAHDRFLRRAIERMVNATLDWEGGCLTRKDQIHYKSTAPPSEDQLIFESMVTSPATWIVRWNWTERSWSGNYSWFDTLTLTAHIFPGDVTAIDAATGKLNLGLKYRKCGFFRGSAHYTLPALISHELLGHGGRLIYQRPDYLWGHERVFRIENQYRRRAGEPEICGAPQLQP